MPPIRLGGYEGDGMTPAEILVPGALRSATGGRAAVPTGEGEVGEALRSFAGSDVRIHRFLFGVDGRIRRSVAVFVNGVDVRNLLGESTPLRDGDRLAIVPALPGG